MTREITNKLLEMVDEGSINKNDLIIACLKWMSEDDVREMAEANEFIMDEDEDDE